MVHEALIDEVLLPEDAVDGQDVSLRYTVQLLLSFMQEQLS